MANNTPQQRGSEVPFTFRDVLDVSLASDYEAPQSSASVANDAVQGFYAAGDEDGTLEVITYAQFEKDKYLIVDANAVNIYATTAGSAPYVPLVKVFATSDASNINVYQV